MVVVVVVVVMVSAVKGNLKMWSVNSRRKHRNPCIYICVCVCVCVYINDLLSSFCCAVLCCAVLCCNTVRSQTVNIGKQKKSMAWPRPLWE